ncbi:hypothetical protein [Streptomyces sp. NRRL S-1022]|uniref:hypothetical protein n=1 Tax=Streptomyces sp. NRRL S-1022 TaxID=1463880 RepID=UPI000A57BA03|nr:hypothetical protein [Streptomyces sp. NRRL S-1022]
MTDRRYAVDLTVDICDLATEEEADEIRYLIEAAIGHYKPTITATTREYDTA